MTDLYSGHWNAKPPEAANPSSAPALVARAQSLHQAGQLSDAEALYRQALAKAPDDPIANHFLGLTLNSLGQTEEADKFLERSIKLLPNDAGFHNNRGHVLIMRGEIAAGEAACRHALTLQPNLAQAHFNVGLALEIQQQRGAAIEELRKATTLNPRYVEAFVALARLLRTDSANAEEVLRLLNAAVSANPQHADAHFHRGHALTQLGRHNEAVESFAQAARHYRHEVTMCELVNALSSVGRNEEARAAFWTSTQINPEYLPAHYGFTQISWTMGRKEEHLSSYAVARQKVGDKPDLLLSEASARIHMGELEEAAGCLERAVEIAPDRPDVAAQFGHALSLTMRHDEAMGAFERAMNLEPDNPGILQSYGSALLRAGQASRAIPILDEAHKLRPADQMVLGSLTTALREIGDERYNHLVNHAVYVRTYDITLPVGFADALAFNRALTQELARFHTRNVEPYDQSLRGGTQTMVQLFQDNSKILQLTRDSIAECVTQYIRDVPNDPSHPTANRKSTGFEFSGSWSSSMRTNGFHTNHLHPMGWISSAYYAQLPSDIEDEAAHHGWLNFGRSAFELNAADLPERFVRPVVGRLVLFPSFYWHGTVPFVGPESRVTIAFDAIPK